jgi:uncharacterized protein YfeS
VPALTSAVGNGPPDVPALSQVSPAHPRFSAHFTAALYEDTAGEFTLFGTDEGADLLAVWTGQAADLTANPTVRHLLAGQVSDNSDVDAVFFDPLAAGDIDAAFTVVSAGFTLLRLTGRIDAEGRAAVLVALAQLEGEYGPESDVLTMSRDLKTFPTT